MPSSTASLRDQRRYNAPSYEPTPEDEAALDYLDDCVDFEAPERLAQEQQWQTNLAFLRGYVYHSFDPLTRQFMFRPASKSWRAKSNRNHVRAYVDRRIATVASLTPEFLCTPENEDEDSYLAADVGKKLVNHEWKRADLDLLMQEVHYWKELTGQGFLKTIFNPNAGERFTEDSFGTDDQGGQFPVQSVMYEGDLEHEVIPTFAIFSQPYLTHPKYADWLMEARYRPIEWVEQNFPDLASVVPMSPPRKESSRGKRTMAEFSTPSGLFGGMASSSKSDSRYCFIRELWAKPSMDYPKGRLIIDADGVILRNGDNPAPEHQIPYRWFRGLIIPGTAWADCNVTHMISPQKDLNRLVSQHIEHIVLTGRAKVLEHATNKLQDGAFRTEIGDTVVWKGMNPPQYLEPPSMPAEIDNEILRCSQHFDSMTGSYGPARGQYQGKMSGRAIDALIEMDQKSEEPQVKRDASELRDWGRMTLKWYRDYVDAERTVRIVGKSEELSIISFQGADLAHSCNIDIDIDSMVPKSRTFALTMIQQLAQVGFFNFQNPEDKQLASKMLSMRSDDSMIAHKVKDQRNATLENRLMLAGIPVDPASWLDDADAHYLKHTDAMKGDAYKRSPPIVKQWFFMHMESHRLLTIPKVGVTLSPEDTMAEGPDQQGGKGGSQPKQKSQGNSRAPEQGGFE